MNKTLKQTFEKSIGIRLAPVLMMLLAVIIQFAAPPVARGQSAGPGLRYDDLPDAANFVIDGRKWNHTNITYYFQNGTGDIPGNDEQQAIREAFQFWANATNLTFTQVGSAAQADIVILWAVGSHGDPFAFDGTNGVLAHAFYPPPNGGSLAGDAHFDDAEFWTADYRDDGAQPIDLVTVAAHEIGHSLGLGHSQFADALMAPVYERSHRYLSQDDIDGIRTLYPLPPYQRIEPTDYDADGRADYAVFTPASGAWQRASSGNGQMFPTVQFGLAGDIPLGGDYDGDRHADLTVYRPSEGKWYIQPSSGGSYYAVSFGLPEDKPVPGDYDRDGRTDVAVWRPSDRRWYILPSSTNQSYSIQFGLSDDKPVPGDYDGDGFTDIAVWRPSDRYWYILPKARGGFYGIQFGLSDDQPTPGDYDGDGKTDLAVFRPSDRHRYVAPSASGGPAGFYSVLFGYSDDVQAAGDYDGDGRTDIAVWRPSEGRWYVLQNSTGGFFGYLLGASGDIPVSALLRY